MERCTHNREMIRIDNPDGTLLKIRSSLANFVPASILIYPVQQLDQLKAVVEIATTSPLLDEQVELLKNLEPVIALSLRAKAMR